MLEVNDLGPGQVAHDRHQLNWFFILDIPLKSVSDKEIAGCPKWLDGWDAPALRYVELTVHFTSQWDWFTKYMVCRVCNLEHYTKTFLASCWFRQYSKFRVIRINFLVKFTEKLLNFSPRNPNSRVIRTHSKIPNFHNCFVSSKFNTTSCRYDKFRMSCWLWAIFHEDGRR